jgi:ribokinase
MPTVKSLGVYVVGSLNMDFVVFVPDGSLEGHQQATSPGRKLPGGVGANQAVAIYRMSRLKGQTTTPGIDSPSGFPFELSVSIVGKVGDNDTYGRTIKAELENGHINTQAVEIAKGCDTGFAHISVPPNGVSQINYQPNANHQLLPSDVKKSWPSFGIDMVVVQLEILPDTACAVVELAAQHRVPVVLNLTPRPKPELLGKDMLFNVDHLIMNNEDADAILRLPAMSQDGRRDRFILQKRYGEAASRFHILGASCVVITLGDMGVLASYHEPMQNEGERSRKLFFFDAQVGLGGVKDDTGASDAFVGAYAVEILKQLHQDSSMGPRRHDVAAAVDVGIRAGGFSVGKIGAMDGLPWRDDVIGSGAQRFKAAIPDRI